MVARAAFPCCRRASSQNSKSAITIAAAAIKTKSKASLAITIEAIRIGSKTTAVKTLASDGGIPANLDFGFCFGGWAFKFSRLDSDDPTPYLTGRATAPLLTTRLPVCYCQGLSAFQSSEAPASLFVGDARLEQLHAAESGPNPFRY